MTWLRLMLFRLYTRRMLRNRQTALLMRKAELLRRRAPERAYVSLDAELVGVQRERIRRKWL